MKRLLPDLSLPRMQPDGTEGQPVALRALSAPLNVLLLTRHAH